MIPFASVQDLREAGVPVADEATAAARLVAASRSVRSALAGCTYDASSPELLAVAMEATVAQVAALTSHGLAPGQHVAAVASSKSLQSASISYAGAEPLAAQVTALASGDLSPEARAVLTLAGLTPAVRVVG